MADGSVRVNPGQVFQYGLDLSTDDRLLGLGSPDAARAIAENSVNGFGRTTPPPVAGHPAMPPVPPIPEAVALLHIVGRNLSDLQAFVKDVHTGVAAIQSAATVMAVAYASADSASADSIGAVAYAFADGSAPKGFPTKGSTTLAAATGSTLQAAQAAGDPAMLQNAVNVRREGDYLFYSFPDGSILRVANTSVDGRFQRTEVAVFNGKDPAPVQANSTSTLTSDDGATTTVTTNSSADPAGGAAITATVTTEHRADGSTVVTTTSTGADGKPTTSTHTYTPTPSSGSAGGLGPVTDYSEDQDTLINPADRDAWSAGADSWVTG